MHRAEARVRQRQSSIQACQRHVFARDGVATGFNRQPQRTRDSPHAFPAQHVGHGVGARGDKWLDELRERVETGARGQSRWQVVAQFRINQGDPGQKEQAAQANFYPMLRRGEHRVARHFRAGAGGGRYRDERRRRVR